MDRKWDSQYIKCGKVLQPDLPNELDQSQPPIVLAEVTVNTKHIPRPSILIKFSEFIHFTLLGLNPKINILYRLVRKEKTSAYEQILQEWQFGFESLNILEVANVDTIQPTVLNFCDCLNQQISDTLTYRLEITEIETNNVIRYSITNKSITANVMSHANEHCKRLICDQFSHHESPLSFVECGKVFNPVLPLQLSKEDHPVVLTELTINLGKNSNTCILVNFSGFVTSTLRESRFNNLTFRLVKTCTNSASEIVNEWQFRRSFTNDTTIKEPIVYNDCACISNCKMPCTYTMELVEVELSENSYYNITNKSMTALIYRKANQLQLW